jgi:5-methylcytosine-specific restriction endonuclease McrA
MSRDDYGWGGPKPSFLSTFDYQQIWHDQARSARSSGREGRLSESGEDPDDLLRMPYWKYLRSRHWEILRQRVLSLGGRRCVYCGTEDHLDVHHLTYVRRGCELDEDLIVLCRTCHTDEHSTQDELDAVQQRAEQRMRYGKEPK